MICKKCGNIVDDDSYICSKCGNKLKIINHGYESQNDEYAYQATGADKYSYQPLENDSLSESNEYTYQPSGNDSSEEGNEYTYQPSGNDSSSESNEYTYQPSGNDSSSESNEYTYQSSGNDSSSGDNEYTYQPSGNDSSSEGNEYTYQPSENNSSSEGNEYTYQPSGSDGTTEVYRELHYSSSKDSSIDKNDYRNQSTDENKYSYHTSEQNVNIESTDDIGFSANDDGIDLDMKYQKSKSDNQNNNSNKVEKKSKKTKKSNKKKLIFSLTAAMVLVIGIAVAVVAFIFIKDGKGTSFKTVSEKLVKAYIERDLETNDKYMCYNISKLMKNSGISDLGIDYSKLMKEQHDETMNNLRNNYGNDYNIKLKILCDKEPDDGKISTAITYAYTAVSIYGKKIEKSDFSSFKEIILEAEIFGSIDSDTRYYEVILGKKGDSWQGIRVLQIGKSAVESLLEDEESEKDLDSSNDDSDGDKDEDKEKISYLDEDSELSSQEKSDICSDISEILNRNLSNIKDSDNMIYINNPEDYTCIDTILAVAEKASKANTSGAEIWEVVVSEDIPSKYVENGKVYIGEGQSAFCRISGNSKNGWTAVTNYGMAKEDSEVDVAIDYKEVIDERIKEKSLIKIREVTTFKSDIAMVTDENNIKRCVDKSGNILFEIECDNFSGFVGDYAVIDESYVIDKTGKVVYDFGKEDYYLYDIDCLEEGCLLLKKDVDTFEKSGTFVYVLNIEKNAITEIDITNSMYFKELGYNTSDKKVNVTTMYFGQGCYLVSDDCDTEYSEGTYVRNKIELYNTENNSFVYVNLEKEGDFVIDRMFSNEKEVVLFIDIADEYCGNYAVMDKSTLKIKYYCDKLMGNYDLVLDSKNSTLYSAEKYKIEKDDGYTYYMDTNENLYISPYECSEFEFSTEFNKNNPQIVDYINGNLLINVENEVGSSYIAIVKSDGTTAMDPQKYSTENFMEPYFNMNSAVYFNDKDIVFVDLSTYKEKVISESFDYAYVIGSDKEILCICQHNDSTDKTLYKYYNSKGEELFESFIYRPDEENLEININDDKYFIVFDENNCQQIIDLDGNIIEISKDKSINTNS